MAIRAKRPRSVTRQDATQLNIRALKKRMAVLERRVQKLETAMRGDPLPVFSTRRKR